MDMSKESPTTKAWMLKWKKLALFSPIFLTRRDAENYVAKYCLGCEVKGGYRPVRVEIKEIVK